MPKDLFELGQQLERQHEIKENIAKAKKDIIEKQGEGLKLALNVSRDKAAGINEHIEALDQELINNQTDIDRSQSEYFERKQRYSIFVDKMHQLYKSEKRLQQKRKQALAAMELAPVQSMKPLKTILGQYAKVSTSGFSCEVLAESLQRLNQACLALGNHPVKTNDYTLSEMDQSWRLDKVTEDIKFGLNPNPNVFFSPYNLAKVARNLGEIGYKNTEVMPLWFEKIDSMLKKTSNEDYIEGAKVEFGQAMFGGLKNFKPRHYIYQGFDGNQEFRQHVDTLIEYEQSKREQLQNKISKSKGNKEYKQVLKAALQLIEAAEEVKDMQQEMQAAVRNIRKQYAKIKEAHDQNEFLQESEYIQLDLLELQEMLIKAGYLSPEERVINDDVSQGALGMDAAVEVFYNMVLSSHPEALSPQYEAFYQASMEGEEKKKLSAGNGDQYAEMRLHTLSSTLVGIQKQALSYRRDIVDRDYPTEFYEKLLMPEEEWLARHEDVMSRNGLKIATQMMEENVQMERTYLNAWRTFYEGSKDIPRAMNELLKRADLGKEDVFSALRALNATCFQAKSLRDKITKAYAQRVNKSRICDSQSLVDGVMGLAGCTYKPKESGNILKDIIRQLKHSNINKKYGNAKYVDSLSFLQSIELLQGFTTPGVPELIQDESIKNDYISLVETLCKRLDNMGFDIISHEVKYDELQILYNAYVNLKYSEDESLRQIWAKSFMNESLRNALEHIEQTEVVYNESGAAKYDPLKPKVMAGLTESIIKADLQHLHIMQTGEIKGSMNKDMFPYAPDILMGYEGQKVGVFVLNNDCVMRDTNEPCGFTKGKMRIVESAHRLAQKSGTSAIKNICLPIRRVVDADLQQHKLALRKDFDLNKFLEESGLAAHIQENRIDTNELSDFSVRLAQQVEQNYNKTTAKLEEFCTQLLHVLRKREQMDSIFEQEQILAGIDELKLQMLKLVMIHDTNLDPLEKQIVQNCLLNQDISFSNFIRQKLVNPINETQDKIRQQLQEQYNNEDSNDFAISKFWQGVRQEVELPTQQNKQKLVNEKLLPKSILPELLNQRFLWYESYHHYDDWESKMKASYDQFNLLELPQRGGKDAPKIYFDPVNFKRRIPNGIFPDARSPRIVLMPPGSELQSVTDLRQANSKLDEMTKFERSPLETMVKNELMRNLEVTSQELSNEMKTITNLQSIKHSLKSDLTDGEICSMLFDNLQFTDKLIDEHLGQQQRSGNANFVQRDAESFRQFLNKQGKGDSGSVSPYDHFYMKEAVRQGNPEEIAQKIFDLQNEHPARPKEELEPMLEQLNKQLEDLLQNYKRANEDQWNISKALGSSVEVSVDINAFTGVQKRNDLGLSPTDLDIEAEHFLKKYRCRAETNLIKSRIIYKVYHDISLSESEQKYLNTWKDKAAQTKTLLPQPDLMVSDQPTTLSLIESLSAEDFYTLNSLSRVSIQDSQREEIALSDLVLELSHFIDPETIRKVELGFLEENLRQEWQLANDFNLVERRNKEIDLVMHEMEEVSWRTADMFDQQEKKYIEDLAFFDRGLDAFDNSFLDMDRESFQNFFDEANNFDSRQILLENWLCRKGEEIKNRVNLAPPDLAKSDQALYEKFDAPLKKARQQLTSKMLVNDEFGNKNAKKAYNQLTTRELHLLTESLCVRMNLFQKKYPAFLPQVIRAIQEHPNLSNSDYNQLSAYCKLFELDWRGDTSLENREQFLMSNPIYLNERDRTSINSSLKDEPITNERVFKKIRQACQPFLPDLLTKINKLCGSDAK